MSRQKQSEEATTPARVHDIRELEQELKGFPLLNAPRSTTVSAQELYLLEQQGYEILQVVMGSIVYSMGVKGLLRSVQRAFTQGEMAEFTRMEIDARNLARNRMLQAAQELGATHVVGVVLDVAEFADFLQIVATGTAVRKVGQKPNLLPVVLGT